MFKNAGPHKAVMKQDSSAGSFSATRPRTDLAILILLHQKTSQAGAVGAWLENRGYLLDIRHSLQGDKLPESLDKHAGVIVFGGHMSANDHIVEKEVHWLDLVLERQLPYFGICLGAQMMIRQLGGEIKPHKNGLVEIGYHTIKATNAGSDRIEKWPERCFQWHSEGFSLPAGATALATGERFPNQAFSYGENIFGVQFHPEITADIITRWSTSAEHMLTKKGAHIKERLLQDHHRYVVAQRQWLHDFMQHWTSLFKPF